MTESSVLPGVIPPRVDALVNERARLVTLAKEDAARVAEIDAELADLLPGIGGRYTSATGAGVRYQLPSRTFDPRAAVTVLTAEQYAAICVPKPDVARARALLPGALVELCYSSNGKPSVRPL